jgi:hypothetical protein
LIGPSSPSTVWPCVLTSWCSFGVFQRVWFHCGGGRVWYKSGTGKPGGGDDRVLLRSKEGPCLSFHTAGAGGCASPESGNAAGGGGGGRVWYESGTGKPGGGDGRMLLRSKEGPCLTFHTTGSGGCASPVSGNAAGGDRTGVPWVSDSMWCAALNVPEYPIAFVVGGCILWWIGCFARRFCFQ